MLQLHYLYDHLTEHITHDDYTDDNKKDTGLETELHGQLVFEWREMDGWMVFLFWRSLLEW